MLNRVRWQQLFALFWFGSVYLALGALLSWEWAWRCAWLNLIVGLVGLLWVTHRETGDHLFYHGPGGAEPGSWQIAFLWGLPVFWLAVATLWWLLRLLGLFSGLR